MLTIIQSLLIATPILWLALGVFILVRTKKIIPAHCPWHIIVLSYATTIVMSPISMIASTGGILEIRDVSDL